MEKLEISKYSKNFGVRLDQVEQYIMAELVEKLNQRPPQIFRDALIEFARAQGVETDLANITRSLREVKIE